MAAGVQYLALLRGINVGGKNLVRMAELRAAFEAMGLADVATYIQSGNVLFGAPRQRRQELAERLESELTRSFGVELKIVLLTHSRLKGVVEHAPPGFGADSHRCDVSGRDQRWHRSRVTGPGVLYYSRLAARASGSRLSRLVMRPGYQSMTIRSWGTTAKLLALMGSRDVD
jgi:uncharacterized protein (DUF1697 family)